MTEATPSPMPSPTTAGVTPRRPDDLPSLLVVTPWYPTEDNPSAGAFVRESVRSLLPFYPDAMIIHVENVPADDDRTPRWSDREEGRVLWIPAAMDPMTSRGDMILAHQAVLAEHALAYLQHAPLVHCHVGAPTGAALVPLLPRSTRFVMTEHASYLRKVFADPKGRDLYERAVRRADELTAVSPSTAWLIEGTFPEARDYVTVVANPVPLDDLPVKTDLTAALSRWLYVGNLVELKGVRRLVRSFARWVEHSGDSRAHLTVVGDGPLREDLRSLAQELGVAERVSFTGRVQSHEVGEVYLQHDVLVHLSHMETFGLTCVEAAACGLPVLVTECGGPQDTLVIHAALGLADFVPISDEHDVEPVVEALSRLQRSIDPANVPVSRRHLRRSYGSHTIGEQLHSVLEGDPLQSGPMHEGMGLLAVAMTAKQARASEAALSNFASFGGGGLYVTSVPVRTALPSSVRVVDISGVERSSLLSRLERALVLRAPALALRGLASGSRAVGRINAPAGRRLSSAVERARTEHRRVAHHFRHRGGYNFLWRNIGPWYAARKLERAGLFDSLDLTGIDHALLADEFMTPLVVRALKVNPELDVRARWTRRAIARLYAENVLAKEPDVTEVEQVDRHHPVEASRVTEVDGADTGEQRPSQAASQDNIRS